MSSKEVITLLLYFVLVLVVVNIGYTAVLHAVLKNTKSALKDALETLKEKYLI
jgi:hypothetical protein